MILSGWKEIARYLHSGVRTVQRWEGFGLPVRRPAHHRRSSVFAVSEEIHRWARSRSNGKPAGEPLSVARIQKTVSETGRLITALRLHATKQQQLLTTLRSGYEQRRARGSGLPAGSFVNLRRQSAPVGPA